MIEMMLEEQPESRPDFAQLDEYLTGLTIDK